MDVYRVDLRTCAVDLDRKILVTSRDGWPTTTWSCARRPSPRPTAALSSGCATARRRHAYVDQGLDGRRPECARLHQGRALRCFSELRIGTDTRRGWCAMSSRRARKPNRAQRRLPIERRADSATRHVVQAVAFDPCCIHWTVVDPSIQAEFHAIAKISRRRFLHRRPRPRRQDVAGRVFERPLATRLFVGLPPKKATFLFSVQPKLDDAPLAVDEAD